MSTTAFSFLSSFLEAEAAKRDPSGAIGGSFTGCMYSLCPNQLHQVLHTAKETNDDTKQAPGSTIQAQEVTGNRTNCECHTTIHTQSSVWLLPQN